jgi:hypothetical protein
VALVSSSEKAGRGVDSNHKALAAALQPLVSRVRTDVTAVKNAKGEQAWTRDALTDIRLAKHLNGGPARGVCPIKAGESVTMVGLLDLDSHKGESTWEEMAEAARAVCDALEARFMAPVPFRSSGGRGIHIYLLWDEPQDAYSVRQELTEVLASLGYANGTKGVKYNEIEVFPKQDSVPADGFGNQFILPLAGQSEPLDMDMDPVGKDAALVMAWPSSAPVPKRERPVREVVAVEASGDLARVQSALDAIPNSGEQSLSYDDYRNIIFAVHHASGGSDEGKEMAREWAAKSEKHNDAFFEERVWPYIRDRDGGITEQTIFAKAREHGWDAPSPEEFPVEVVGETAVEAEAWPTFARDKAGRIEPTVTNTVAAVARPDLVGLQVAYDEFRDEITVAEPGTTLQWRPMTDADAVTIRMGLERIGFKAAPKELARDACVRVAANNSYDSAQLWLESLRWDGVPRVEKFLVDYMGCDDTPYTRAVAFYMWSALAGRVMKPGVKADMVPIYEGDQGLRKSSAIEALSPAPEFFVEIDFDKKEEETVRALRGVLVGEVAELSGLHTRQIEWIKKFVVRKIEKWIPKYKEFATTFARRLLFIGTTNRTDILADETGNRRWLPLHITKADVEGIVKVRDQLWAEAAVLFAANGVMWHEAETLAVEHHDNYTMEDSWESDVSNWLEAKNDFDEEGPKNKDRLFSTADVLVGALRLSPRERDRLAQKRVCAILRGFGYVQKITRINGVAARTWRNTGASACNTSCNASSVAELA